MARDKYARLQDDLYLRKAQSLRLILTTVEQYQSACAGTRNEAGRQIDMGKEPYLLSTDALDLGLGTHPFIPVWDVLQNTPANHSITLLVVGRQEDVPRDTLVAWKY